MRAAANPNPQDTHDDDVLDASQVAARFLRSKDWFLRARLALEKRGFPPPIDIPAARPRRPKTGRGRPSYVWDGAAIKAWFAAQAPAHLHPFMGIDTAANENASQPPGQNKRTAATTLEGRLL